MATSFSRVDMRGIVKRFPGVLANDHIDFTCRAGDDKIGGVPRRGG